MRSKKTFLQNIITIIFGLVLLSGCSKNNVRVPIEKALPKQKATQDAINYRFQGQYYQQSPYGSRVVVPNSRSYSNPYDFQPSPRDNDQEYIVPNQYLGDDFDRK